MTSIPAHPLIPKYGHPPEGDGTYRSMYESPTSSGKELPRHGAYFGRGG
jgi:hypothetical protein